MTITRKETDSQADLIEKAHRVLPGGSVGNVYSDTIIRRGAGSHIWDVSGNEYIDYLLGSGPMLIGHAHPDIVAAVSGQIGQGSTFFATHELAILLAEEVTKAIPCAEQVRFTSTGTEATLYAMRTARAARGRDRILKFEGGFHGMNDYALMSTFAPENAPPLPAAVPDSAGLPGCIENEMLIAPFNDIDAATALIEQHHDTLGGVIVEPCQRVIPPAPGFLAALREVTARFDVPLIFDEIVTGFRVAYGGAQEYYGVTPDLCAIGKAMAGGMPLAAVAGRKELMDCFNPTSKEDGRYMPHYGTLNGNPISAASGLAALAVLRREGTYERLFDTGRQLMTALQQAFDGVGTPVQVIGAPPVFDIYFTDQTIRCHRDTLTADTAKVQTFNRRLLDHGIFRGDTKFYISIMHSQEDVDRTVAAFNAVAEEMAATSE
jgi:glutamate-1-semialdehyde 2,1-aminomutase